MIREVNPLLITVSFNLMDTTIDPIINSNGSNYYIFAVAYTNQTHFLAGIQLTHGVHEYDGMKLVGCLQEIKANDPFQSKIKKLSNKNYKAQMVWYKKKY